MHILLTDALTCPRCGPDFGLIVLAEGVEDRRVPCENNRAERELRPTVIARKVLHGSQSEEGAKT